MTDTKQKSLIEKSFRYLAKIARLGEFWSSVLRHYGKDVPKLDDSKIRYIVRARGTGESASDIARNLFVSRRRVEQVYAHYRRNGALPSLSKPGRRSVPITDDEIRFVLLAHGRYRVGALYLKGEDRA